VDVHLLPKKVVLNTVRAGYDKDYAEAACFLTACDVGKKFRIDPAKFLQSKFYRHAVNVVLHPHLPKPVREAMVCGDVFVEEGQERTFCDMHVLRAMQQLQMDIGFFYAPTHGVGREWFKKLDEDTPTYPGGKDWKTGSNTRSITKKLDEDTPIYNPGGNKDWKTTRSNTKTSIRSTTRSIRSNTSRATSSNYHAPTSGQYNSYYYEEYYYDEDEDEDDEGNYDATTASLLSSEEETGAVSGRASFALKLWEESDTSSVQLVYGRTDDESLMAKVGRDLGKTERLGSYHRHNYTR